MAAPAAARILTGPVYDVPVQLAYKLPGKYHLVRRDHHPHIVEGTNQNYEDLLCPSHGTSEITLRLATGGVELLQTTVINLRFRNGQTATKTERRAFRIRAGLWTMWMLQDHGGSDILVRKLADLKFTNLTLPFQIGVTVGNLSQIATLMGGPWPDGHGANGVILSVWVGAQRNLLFTHQVYRLELDIFEVQRDELWPVVEDGEGRA